MSNKSSLVVADPTIDKAPNADTAPQMFYRIESSHHKEFGGPQLAIKQSKTLGRLIETMGYTAEDVERKPPIPLKNIAGDILTLVFKWCQHHEGEPIAVDDKSVPMNVVISKFDKKLLQIDNTELLHSMCAAEYLGIKQLLNVSAKKVTDMTDCKSPEELETPTDEENKAAQRTDFAKQEAVARKTASEGPNVSTGKGSKNS